MLALFDRAAARDFADVYVLARRFGKAVMLARAAQIDAGFDARVLADMIATLDRFTDGEIPVPDGSSAAELRAFYAAGDQNWQRKPDQLTVRQRGPMACSWHAATAADGSGQDCSACPASPPSSS